MKTSSDAAILNWGIVYYYAYIFVGAVIVLNNLLLSKIMFILHSC